MPPEKRIDTPTEKLNTELSTVETDKKKSLELRKQEAEQRAKQKEMEATARTAIEAAAATKTAPDAAEQAAERDRQVAIQQISKIQTSFQRKADEIGFRIIMLEISTFNPKIKQLSAEATKAAAQLVTFLRGRHEVLNKELAQLKKDYEPFPNADLYRVKVDCNALLSRCIRDSEDEIARVKPTIEQGLSISDHFLNVLKSLANLFIRLANMMKSVVVSGNPYTLYKHVVVGSADFASKIGLALDIVDRDEPKPVTT